MAQVDVRAPQTERRAGPASNGKVPKPARSGLPRPPGLRVLGALAVVVSAVAGFYLYDQSLYVFTDQAVVTGVPIFVSSPTAGQIRSVDVNVGDEVAEGQRLATIAVGFGPNTMFVPVRSPIDGVVVARSGNPGDFTSTRAEGQSAGRPILTLVDPDDLWIEAPIDELQIGRVRPGQKVDVTINSLGEVLPGSVMSVGRASADASTQLKQGPVSASNTFRGRPHVPVRIEVGYGDVPLFVGASASVRIHVQDR